jgi:hypothetical protein
MPEDYPVARRKSCLGEVPKEGKLKSLQRFNEDYLLLEKAGGRYFWEAFVQTSETYKGADFKRLPGNKGGA